ncbi:uncharacterized protein LOC121634776 isoform X2 [Melanotaenia boesemani]|nr:uncharacterized protein LOC121634776 isoform X2 [Melanotaenia boesemani]XP_041833627.1 uncharacterized protein LOC121634776 isoform X2 [Melanotaenia boesemani]
MKNDAKKQREFFEKRKMEQKLRKLGVAMPVSSAEDTGSGSTDLMTLFIVNQIATKKANKDPPKVAVLSSCKGRSMQWQNSPLVLPMSPCSPSQLSLVESQPHCRVQGISNRKNFITQKFKGQQLSPVLESAFSDNSASDYLPPITNPSSPTPSTSSASSGQGMFPLQMNLQRQNQTQFQPLPHFSPPPWHTSVQRQTLFQPFSQPRAMADAAPWACRPNSPLFQLKTPTAARGLFGSPKSDETEARDHEGHAGSLFLKQQEDREPMGDFMFNQPETNHLFEEDISRGFGNEEYEREASYSGYTKSKICLVDETSVRSSAPQTVPDPESMRVELSSCTDMNSPCLGQNTGHVNEWKNSPSCSCRACYQSSDSSDDEVSYGSSFQAFHSCMDHTCCADHLNKTSGNQGQQMGSRMFLSQSPLPLAQTNSELCKCKKTPTETQDVGTQTLYCCTPDTCDASTQCNFVSDSETKASGFSVYRPNVDVLEQQPATERHTCAGPQILTASLDNSKREGKQISWSKNNSKAGSLSGSSSFHTFTASSSTKVILQRPTNPFQEVLTMRGKENVEGRGERQQHENSPLVKDVAGEEKEESTSAGKCNALSEEAEMLQEIADILLLLKQRKKEE